MSVPAARHNVEMLQTEIGLYLETNDRPPTSAVLLMWMGRLEAVLRLLQPEPVAAGDVLGGFIVDPDVGTVAAYKPCFCRKQMVEADRCPVAGCDGHGLAVSASQVDEGGSTGAETSGDTSTDRGS